MSRRSTRRATAQRRSARPSRTRATLGRNSVGQSLYRRRLGLEPLEERRLLAITVTTLDDTIDFNDGVTSLREAIFAANTVPGADTIEFAPELTASGPGSIWLSSGEIQITDDLTIQGPGAETLSIQAAVESRIFNVDNGSISHQLSVSIEGLKLIGARSRLVDGGAILNRENLSILDSTIENSYTGGNGGGIYSISGNLSLRRSSVQNNLSLASGGGIYVADGTLEIEESNISGNRAPNNRGGGIVAYRAETTIARSTLAANSAVAGGGIFHQDASLDVKDSLITGNAADGGGGIRIYRSKLQLSTTTVSNNQATYQAGGGIRGVEANATVIDSHFVGNSAARGGGIWMYRSSLAVTDSGVENNTASQQGGGIGTTDGELKVVNCTISGNVAGGPGGGICSGSVGTLVVGSTVIENVADGGGGVFATRGLQVVDCVIRRNVATGSYAAFGGGGGVWNYGGATLTRCDISENSTAFGGGGVYIFSGDLSVHESSILNNMATSRGGGIYNRFANLELRNSTISGNVAGDVGGGIYTSAAGKNVSLRQSTIAANSAETSGGGIYLLDGVLRLDHVIVATNTAPSGPDLARFNVATFEPRYSIIGDGTGAPLAESPSGAPDARGNVIGGPVHGVIDPMLGPLADNGGFELPDGSRILTHALLPDSPAINAGELHAVAGEGGVPEFDQRGEPFGRVVGGRIDVGAFEYQMPTDLKLLIDTLADESDGDYSRGDLSLREAIELSNAYNYEGIVDTIRFDPALAANGPATILLTMGEFKILDSLSINGPGAELLTIDASGNDPTPDVNNGDGSRIFNTTPSSTSTLDDVPASLSISGLTLTGGDAPGSGGAILSAGKLNAANCIIINNYASIGGGGIALGRFRLFLPKSFVDGSTLIGCQIIGNSARSGVSYGGGGLAVADFATTGSGHVLISECMFDRNSNMGSGGGIYASGSNLSVEVIKSVIRNNRAHGFDGDGGGIYSGARLSVEQSLIGQNQADYFGGGICATSGTQIVNSTISGNIVLVGATWRGSAGGGIAAFKSLVVENSTITANVSTGWNDASALGSGIFAFSEGVHLNHAIVAGNKIGASGRLDDIYGTATMKYSLLGMNQGTAVVDDGGNLVGTLDSPIDPKLGPLADNGGFELPDGSRILTHALLPGSPAINAGDLNAVAGQGGVPAHDQRGAPFTRGFGGRIDIGAVESIPHGFLPGDYHVDGKVDAVDYLVWREAVGENVPPGTSADGNGDGVVDERDYAVWKSNFGTLAEQLVTNTEATEMAARIAHRGLPPAEPGADGDAQVAASIGGFALQPTDLPGVPERAANRGRQVAAASRDWVLEAWLACRRPLIDDDAPFATLACEATNGEVAAADDAFDQMVTFSENPRQSRGLRGVFASPR